MHNVCYLSRLNVKKYLINGIFLFILTKTKGLQSKDKTTMTEEIKIENVNLPDIDKIAEYLKSEKGKGVVLGVLKGNKEQLKAMLQGTDFDAKKIYGEQLRKLQEENEELRVYKEVFAELRTDLKAHYQCGVSNCQNVPGHYTFSTGDAPHYISQHILQTIKKGLVHLWKHENQ